MYGNTYNELTLAHAPSSPFEEETCSGRCLLRDENGHIIEHTEYTLCLFCFLYNDYNFSIKCGGPQITSNNQIIYERDNETLGPASYYVTSENRCAVSNVGLFIDSSQPQYRSFSLCVRDLRLGFDPEEKGKAAGMKTISKVSPGSSNASGSSSSKEQHNQQYPETERIEGHEKQHGERFRMTVKDG
ncbi:hypothetical protein HYC85_007875 [Camellia sinensis]|uniref:Uncharacterized protein n=1 Tax=Camellia sinensis TaxID=4442 RepID=A0A7J7HQU2_CAMSI|nr:hypothetical protein HYC85_007875 [Camellia sinensis]